MGGVCVGTGDAESWFASGDVVAEGRLVGCDVGLGSTTVEVAEGTGLAVGEAGAKVGDITWLV